MAYAVEHYHKRSNETSTLIDLLLKRYRVVGMTMPKTMEEFRKYYLMYNLEDLTPEERMAGLSAEQRVQGRPPEELLRVIPPEERVRGLPPEERLKGLSPEEIRAYLKRLENGSDPTPSP